jgi:hypothetical protein
MGRFAFAIALGISALAACSSTKGAGMGVTNPMPTSTPSTSCRSNESACTSDVDCCSGRCFANECVEQEP